MTPDLLMKHFDRISEAPDAIPRLRGFILDLAVRGKLAPQEAPCNPLGLPNLQLPIAPAARTETADRAGIAVIPSTWVLKDLEHLSEQITDGEHATPPRIHENQVPLVTAKNVRDGFMEFDTTDWVSHETAAKAWGRCYPKVGDILLVCVGATTGRLCILREAKDMVLVRSVALIRPKPTIEVDYLALALRSPFCQRQIWSKVKVSAQPCLYINKIKSLVIPIPPEKEQQRIVSKVEELMALCDRLEAAQVERNKRRHTLLAAANHHMTSPEDCNAFRVHAKFFIHHLPSLTIHSEEIDRLRQTLLSLAVSGKLVPQDQRDEPASQLLMRINEEKTQLANQGIIGRPKPVIPANASELQFSLLPGWAPARIGQVILEMQTGPFGSALHQSDYQKGGIPVINPASIKDGCLVPIESMAVGPATLERLASFKLRAGDIVIGRRGEMGRCAVVTEREEGWLCGTGSLILRLASCVCARFFVMLIGSPQVRKYLGGSAVGATMQNLNQSILLALVIGLPPHAEQRRIADRVDELMRLCDELEARITSDVEVGRRLLEAVLSKALEITEISEGRGLGVDLKTKNPCPEEGKLYERTI